VRGIGAWNRDKSRGGLSGSGKSPLMLTLNEIEGEMAAANARVNELVALQAEMLLRAAEVRNSRRYRDSAECRASRIGSAPTKGA